MTILPGLELGLINKFSEVVRLLNIVS